MDVQALGAAQAMFDGAEQLMAAHKYDEACPKLEEVVRLVPSGVGAKIELAKCYEEAGRLASAWGAYVVAGNAAAAAGQAERTKAAAEHAAALKPRLSTLTISVPAGLRAVPGLEIRRDGRVLGQAEWGIAVPVDPGAHPVEATAPGKAPWHAAAEVKGDADAASIALPERLDDAPDAAPPPTPVPPRPHPDAATTPSSPPIPEAAPTKPAGGPPVWAWAVGGAGVALLGASVGFLVDERVTQADIDKSCPGLKLCVKGFDASGANARLYRDFDVFVGAGVAGVVAAGAGIVGVVVGRKRAKGDALVAPLPWAGPGAAGMGWAVRF